MVAVHAGVPLSVPDGLLGHHPAVVRWGAPASGWQAFVDNNPLLGGGAAVASLADWEPEEGWHGFHAGDVLVGTLGDLLDLPTSGVRLLVELERVTALSSTDIADLIGLVPIYVEVPETVRWIKSTISGRLAGVEDIVHTINWRHDGPGGGSDATDMDLAALQAFSDVVRGAWKTAFSNSHGPGEANPQNVFSTSLAYTEVKCAVVEQSTATSNEGSNKGKINQTGVVAKSLFIGADAFAGGGAGVALPFEVAACATLLTVGRQTGGVSHGRQNRGRLFFGGLTTAAMSAGSGLYDPVQVNTLAHSLGAFYDAVHTATDHHAAVVSNRYVKSLPITQIKMGVVPDVQTSRRRSQTENYGAIWSGQLDTVTIA